MLYMLRCASRFFEPQLLEDALDMRTQQLFHLQKVLVLHTGEAGTADGSHDHSQLTQVRSPSSSRFLSDQKSLIACYHMSLDSIALS